LYLISAMLVFILQTTVTAALNGTVSDSSQSIVPGAIVTLTSTDTNLSISTETNERGFYSFPRIVPGAYSLSIEKPGFRSERRTGLTFAVNQTAVLDVQLGVGGVAESVGVEAFVPIVHTQSTEISELVDERRVRELPLNGKDFNKLVLIAPGVSPTSSSTGSPAVAGSRTTTNNYAIDGIASNGERVDGLPPGGGFNSLGNAIPNVISTEAIREFRIITSNADATYGRGSGGQINIVTKSGTKDFHGSAYEYFRNDKLDARDFFNSGPFFNKDGTVRTPPFRQNLYGASLGGPLLKQRHFFFGNYEGFRQRREQTTALTLPNADLIRLIPGDLGLLHRTFYLDGGIISTNGNIGTFAALPVADRAAAANAGFPAALFDGDSANGEAGTLLISSTLQSDYTQNAFLVRTDHNLSNRFSMNLRLAFAENVALGGVLSDRIREPKKWVSPMLQATYTLSPSQMVEMRGAVQRNTNRTVGVDAADPKLNSIGISSEKGMFVSSTGTSGIRFIRIRSALAAVDNETVPQGALVHTFVHGRMTLRSGFEIRRMILNVASSTNLPQYAFTGFVGPNGLLGASPSQAQAISSSATTTVFGSNGGPTTPMRGLRSTQQEYFSQADWKLKPNVVVNAGLRYVNFGVYSEVNNALSNLYAVDSSGNVIPDVGAFSLGRTANRIDVVRADRPLYQPDRNNFEPRVGVAYSIGANAKTAIRAGYGLYHDRITPLEFTLIAENPPYAVSSLITPPAGQPLNGFPFLLRSSIPVNPLTAPPTTYSVDTQLQNPSTSHFNVAIERQVDQNTSITAAYVGSRGRKLIRYTNPNGGASVPLTLRPDPRFATQRYVSNGSSSRYDALQIFGRHRLSRRLDLTAAYAFSRSLDDVSAGFEFSGDGPSLINRGADPIAAGVQGGGALFVPRDLKADYGYSTFDVRHSLVVTHVVDLPFGFSLAGFIVVRSGQPFNVTLGRDANDDGVADDRPALLKGSLEDLYLHGGSRTQYLIAQGADLQSRLNVSPKVTDPFSVIPRNALRAPSIRFYDVSLIKRFSLAEGCRLNLEFNAFNVFNNVLFGAPVSTVSDARFGLLTSTLANSNPRQLQLGAKLTF
jgi:hypothetical protein